MFRYKASAFDHNATPTELNMGDGDVIEGVVPAIDEEHADTAAALGEILSEAEEEVEALKKATAKRRFQHGYATLH